MMRMMLMIIVSAHIFSTQYNKFVINLCDKIIPTKKTLKEMTMRCEFRNKKDARVKTTWVLKALQAKSCWRNKYASFTLHQCGERNHRNLNLHRTNVANGDMRHIEWIAISKGSPCYVFSPFFFILYLYEMVTIVNYKIKKMHTHEDRTKNGTYETESPISSNIQNKIVRFKYKSK